MSNMSTMSGYQTPTGTFFTPSQQFMGNQDIPGMIFPSPNQPQQPQQPAGMNLQQALFDRLDSMDRRLGRLDSMDKRLKQLITVSQKMSSMDSRISGRHFSKSDASDLSL
jgi:hypothetical protein